MDISVSTGFYYTKGYKEILDIIASTTCKNIELFLNQAFIDVPIEELKREIEVRGLKVLSVHTPLEFISFPRLQSEEYWINRSIELSKTFGSKVIVSHMVLGNYFDENIKDLDAMHKKNIISYCKNKDFIITTENMPRLEVGCFLGNYDKLFEFISTNNIFLTFDTTHCASAGHSIIDKFRQFKNFIKNIHLSDFQDGIEHRVLGEGSLPLKDFLRELKKENYEGIVTIELDFDNKKRNNILDNGHAISEIQKSIDYIREVR